MTEDYKLEQKYKDMIRKMATRAGSVVSDSYRDLFIEMAMEYLDSNGTTALSEALAKNADKYVSMLELGELITDTGSFIQSINQYSYASEIRKPQLAKEILSNFFGMADFVAGEIPLDPLFGAYISLVFEVADFALNEGADMLEEHNNQLLDVMELCDMAVNKPSSFDEYISGLSQFAATNQASYINRVNMQNLINNAQSLNEQNSEMNIKVNEEELLGLVDEYNSNLDDFRSYFSSFLDEASALGIELSPETFQEIENICGNMSIPYKYDYDPGSGLITPAYSAEDTFGNAEAIVGDPIVIDMGKTGFELTSQEEGVHFDMDGNTLYYLNL